MARCRGSSDRPRARRSPRDRRAHARRRASPAARVSCDDDPDAAATRIAGSFRSPSAVLLTAWTPPKKRLWRVPAIHIPARREAPRRRRRATPLRGGASSPSTWSRGARIAAATCIPLRIRHVTWAMAPARRTEPALPMTSSRPAGVEHECRRHHARQALAGRLLVRSDHVELAEHVVQLRAIAEDTRAGAERRRERGGHPRAVDDRDVRRPRERAGAERPVRVRDRARLVLEARVALLGEEREDALDHPAALRRRREDCAAEDVDAREAPSGARGTRGGRPHTRGARSATIAAPDVADALERGDRIRRADARAIAVDAPAAFVAQEDPVEDPVQESRAARRGRSPREPARSPARRGRSTHASRSGRWISSRPTSSRGLRPIPRRRGTPASPSRRSR